MHLLRVINHLDRQIFCPSLALARSGGSYESALAQDVKVHFLDTGRIPSSTLRMLRAIAPLHRIIQQEQPDLICSVLDHANTIGILATRNLPVRPKVVLSIQNTLSVQLQHSKNLVNQLFRSLIVHLYPQANCIVALSEGVARDLNTLIPRIKDRIEVIYNAGLDEQVLQGIQESLPNDLPIDRPLIVACGRLTEQKGFPDLLEAFAQVRQVIPATLWIVGEGKQRPMLEQKIQELGLSQTVKLLGFQQNPYKYMAAADVFVLSSLYEGFGNVIVEAMACGAPVVATNCPSGPAEIIEDGLNGLLVPIRNVEAMAQAIIKVLTNPNLKHQLAEAGKVRAQDFHSQTIASAYGQLFLQVAHTASNGQNHP